MKKRLLVLLDKRINDKIIINNELLKIFKLRTIIEDYKDYDIYFICPIRDYYVLTKAFKINKKKIVYYKNEDEIINIIERRFLDMKFDKVIMNPPYNSTLHIKILKELKKSQNTNCNIITIQPNYLENYKDSIDVDLIPNKIQVINREYAQRLFGNIQLNYNLAIMTFDGSKEKIDNSVFIPAAYNIYKKLTFNKTLKDVNIINYDCDGIFVPLKLMTSVWDMNKNDIIDKVGIVVNGYTLGGIYYKDKRSKNKDRPFGGIKFNSLQEANNFIDSCRTTFYKTFIYIMHLNSRYILQEYPFMEDYTQPWTNERFCNHFGITGFISDTEAEPGSEWEEILNAMKEYM